MKCKNCKDKFEPRQFNRKYCTKDECNNLYFEFLKAQALKKWSKEKKVKKGELANSTGAYESSTSGIQ